VHAATVLTAVLNAGFAVSASINSGASRAGLHISTIG